LKLIRFVEGAGAALRASTAKGRTQGKIGFHGGKVELENVAPETMK